MGGGGCWRVVSGVGGGCWRVVVGVGRCCLVFVVGGGECWRVVVVVCGWWWALVCGRHWCVVGVGVWWALACGGCQQMADGGGWLQVLENLGLTESCPVVELNPVQPGHVLVQPYQFFSRKTSQINSKKRI